MATSVEAKIQQALFAHMEAISLTPAKPIAWPNLSFTPPATGYLRVNDLPAPTQPFALAHDGANEYAGLFQVDVMWQQGRGAQEPKEAAGAVAKHFRRGVHLRNGGVLVEVTRASVGPAIKDDPFMMTPVTIRYRAFVPNGS